MSKRLDRGRSFWSVMVAEHEQSGRTVADFAVRRGVNAHTLSWWRWKLRASSSQLQSEGVRFLRVVTSPGEAEPIEIVLPGGAVVRASGVRLESVLRAVVAATRC